MSSSQSTPNSNSKKTVDHDSFEEAHSLGVQIRRRLTKQTDDNKPSSAPATPTGMSKTTATEGSSRLADEVCVLALSCVCVCVCVFCSFCPGPSCRLYVSF